MKPLHKPFVLLFCLYLAGNTGLQAQQTVNYNFEVITCYESTSFDIFTGTTVEECVQSVSLETLAEATVSQKGANISFDNSRKLVYTYNADGTDGGFGIDFVSGTVSCSGITLSFQLQLLVLPCPDNIDPTDCKTEVEGFEYAIGKKWASTETNVATYVSPVIGDLNGDGYSEIVVGRYNNGVTGGNTRIMQNLYMYDGASRLGVASSGATISINTPTANYMPAGILGLALVKIENDMVPLIVMIAVDGYLYAYDPYNLNGNVSGSNQVWKSDQQITSDYSATAGGQTNTYGSVAFADFNNDGIAEVYAANRIFNAATGKLLLEVSAAPYGRSRTYGTTTYQYMPGIADIDGDGKLEYIAGTKIYSVHIENLEGTAGNSMTEIFDIGSISVTGGSNTITDGISMVADFNNDGYLDVVVFSTFNATTYGIAIWDIKNLQVLGTIQDTTNGSYFVGIPFIGDVDADGDLEILVTSALSSSQGYVNGYHWDRNTGAMTRRYRLVTSDYSGATGITLFDFNQSGKPQLVYRDQSQLRIIDATYDPDVPANTKLSDIITISPVTSGTFFESAMVADVDNDGAAEIITTGGSSSNVIQGTLQVFGSGNEFSWAPARRVWNQYSYNVVNVNDDLTIPKYRMSPATFFADGHQPFNNALQQQTALDKNGNQFRPLPQADWIEIPTYTRGNDKITITGIILNSGAIDLQTPITITAYQEEVGGTILGNVEIDKILAPGEEYTIDVDFDLSDDTRTSRIVFTVNDAGGGIAVYDQCGVVAEEIVYFINAVDDHRLLIGDMPDELTINIIDNDYLGIAEKPEYYLYIPETDGAYPPLGTEPCTDCNFGSGKYPQYGTIILDGDNIVYTPGENFPGRDEFTYTLMILDGPGYIFDEATVVIERIQTNDDSYIIQPSKSINCDVTTNDFLATGLNATIILPNGNNNLKQPSMGTVVLDSSNPEDVIYSTDNEGLDEFEYMISYQDPLDSENWITDIATVYIISLNTERITCDDSETVRLVFPPESGIEYSWHKYSEEEEEQMEIDGITVASPVIVPIEANTDLTISKEDKHYRDAWLRLYYDIDGVDQFPDRLRMRVRYQPGLMYWHKNTTNNNWNDPANWVDENGNAFQSDDEVSFVPWTCTDVHIPGNAANYPMLDGVNSPQGTYGAPVCNHITFHFGGEVARPDLLTYNRAFVQYNVGNYNGDYSLLQNGDATYSTTPMERGRWYGLGIPLKRVATGDFGFGGYPNTWQMSFERSTATDGSWIGDFSEPFNTNDVELNESQAYSYALWVNDYTEGELGSDDHKGLDAVSGIIELPYYENTAASDAHRIHSYNPATNVSSFKYYYWQAEGMPFVPESIDPYGTINRRGNAATDSEDDAYRFVFDGRRITINGKSSFTVTVPGGKEIMIGNPLMSTLDFDNFYTVNSTKIKEYYRLFDGDFDTYGYKVGAINLTKNIAPLQGFFIETIGSDNVELVFPFVDVSITDNSNKLKASRHTMKPDVLYITSNTGGATSSAILSLSDTAGEDIPALFYPYAESPQLYILGENNQRNAIQYASYKKEITFGYSMSKESDIKLSFLNTENIHANSLILLDRITGEERDLFANPSYTFHSDSDSFSDRFILKIGTSDTGIEDKNTSDSRTIITYCTDNRVIVRSEEGIKSVKVYDMQGILHVDAPNVNSGYFSHALPFKGVFIAKVLDGNGIENMCKIINY